MSIGLAPRKPIDLELRLAVTGLAFGLVALALWASMERPRMLYAAAFGPEDLKAWGLAVAAFASSIATAVASLIVAGKGLIRFGQWLFAPTPKRPRKPRKRKADAPKPDPPPVA